MAPFPFASLPFGFPQVALPVAGLLLLTACSGAVEIDSPDVDGETRAACESLLADIPSSFIGLDEVEVSPQDALGRAWGDPAVTVTCGVGVPTDFNDFSLCDEVNGIGWFVPDDAVADLGNPGGGSSDGVENAAVLTSVTHGPRIELVVPPEHYPPADFTATISDLITEHGFEEIREPCV